MAFAKRVVTLYSLLETLSRIDDSDVPVIFLDGVGTQLRVYTGVDMTGASVALRVEKASGEIAVWTGTVDSTNPFYILYTLVADDLDIVEGDYCVSAEVTVSSVVGKGTITKFIARKQYLSQEF